MTARLSLVAVLILLTVTGEALAHAVRSARPSMGTVLEVTVIADDAALAQALADRCFELARHWEDVLTTWRPDGELEQVNSRAGRGPVAIGADLEEALARMLALSNKTGGAFNPAVGSIVALLRNHESASTPAAGVPPLNEVLRVAPGVAEIRESVRLDAGGIGKGMALDAIADMLRRAGARAWFLNFGGSSQLAHGRPESRDAWSVAIAALEPGRVHGTLSLRDVALSTSRAVSSDEPSGAIVDPRSGRKVSPSRLATVAARDATTADAWSTALVVLGPAGVDAARNAGVEALYEDASGAVSTNGFPLLGWPGVEPAENPGTATPRHAR